MSAYFNNIIRRYIAGKVMAMKNENKNISAEEDNDILKKK